MVTADNAEAADGKRFGRVALSQDESACVAVARASLVRVIQLWNAWNRGGQAAPMCGAATVVCQNGRNATVSAPAAAPPHPSAWRASRRRSS
eukprot:354903-Chlamydomonas_euryale.AAC.35